MRMFTVNKFIYYLFEVKNRRVLPPHLQCVSIKMRVILKFSNSNNCLLLNSPTAPAKCAQLRFYSQVYL
jgi:hypothetical protein